jgi:hypothetical protein
VPPVLNAGSAASAEDYFTKHSVLQSVNSDGTSSYSFTPEKKFKGIVLNNPEDMLNSAAGAPGFMGGQWQVFIQAVDLEEGEWDPMDSANKGSGADFGGTALWMGQYIGKMKGDHPAGSYTDGEWDAEIERLDYPLVAGTGQPGVLRAGDLIEVLARGSLWYGGKQNINEEHNNAPSYDFEITIIQPGYGLPDPVEITLSDVKDGSDNFIFNATDPDENGIPLDYAEIIGCEKYQSQLVTIQDVSLVDPESWGANAMLTLSDGLGRTFPMHLGINPDLVAMGPPAGTFDVTGIFNQETGTPTQGIDSYELWVMTPIPVPEPTGLVLALSAGLALLALGLRSRVRKGSEAVVQEQVQ